MLTVITMYCLVWERGERHSDSVYTNKETLVSVADCQKHGLTLDFCIGLTWI